MLSQDYNVIIDHGVNAPVHGREVVDGFYTTDKCFILQLMATMQLPGSKGC